jgi:hypothetical protein
MNDCEILKIVAGQFAESEDMMDDWTRIRTGFRHLGYDPPGGGYIDVFVKLLTKEYEFIVTDLGETLFEMKTKFGKRSPRQQRWISNACLIYGIECDEDVLQIRKSFDYKNPLLNAAEIVFAINCLARTASKVEAPGRVFYSLEDGIFIENPVDSE